VKVSVVMASYNGAEYIYEQLESIKNQTRKADEVVISDDNSTDDTYDICRKYIGENNLDNWKLIKTKHNLGYYLNFMNAIENSIGDIIFLADQDDVWRSNKIYEMSNIMENNHKIFSLASTFSYIDKAGNITQEYQSHPYKKKNDIKKIDVYKFYRHPYYLGMSMALRRELYERIKTVEHFGLTHDLMFNLYASQNGNFYYYDKVLTDRRRHGNNTSAMTNKNDKNKEFQGTKEMSYNYWRKLKHYNIMLQILSKDNMDTKVIERFIKSQKSRYEYVENSNITAWIKNIVNIQCYETKLHYINDARILLKK
jgi:glycosyltransferase involved in cell wall biosynthesis